LSIFVLRSINAMPAQSLSDWALYLLRIRFPCLVIPDKRIEYKEHLFLVVFGHDGYLPDPTECCRIQFGIDIKKSINYLSVYSEDIVLD
jgi:hypothetical protein